MIRKLLIYILIFSGLLLVFQNCSKAFISSRLLSAEASEEPVPAGSSSSAATILPLGSYWMDPRPLGHFSPGGGTTVANGSAPSSPMIAGGVSEMAVWANTVSHYTTDNKRAWEIRLGSGGQIYSILDSNNTQFIGLGSVTNGESVIQSATGQWMDRVLQFIAVAPTSASTGFTSFIQSGAYATGTGTPDYAKLLDQHYDSATSTLHLLSWPQQSAQFDWTKYPEYQSNYLLQTDIRDLGDVSPQVSAIEITYSLVNFGTLSTPNWFNLPWTGWDTNTAAFSILSNPTGGWSWLPANQSWIDPVDTAVSGGWAAYTSTRSNTVPTFGIVFANSGVHGALQLGVNGNGLSILSVDWSEQYGNKNYMAPPKSTFYQRFYLLFSRSGISDFAIQANALASGLVSGGQVSYSLSQASPTQNCKLLKAHGINTCAWYALSHPVIDPLPLFILRNKVTGKSIVSTSPYIFGTTMLSSLVSPTTSTSTDYLGFVGWGIRVTSNVPPRSGMAKLSTLLNSSEFIDPAKISQDAWVSTEQ